MRLYINRSVEGDGVDEGGQVVHHHTHHHHHGGDHSIISKHPATVDVMEHLDEKPHTWSSYPSTREGGLGIVKMEMNELLDAIERNSEEHVCQELVDLAAACIHALKMK